MALYAAGATLCFRNINSLSDNLASFSARVRQDLGFLGKVDLRAYLSPDGQGFDTHFDARVATTLQVEGRKRWRYSNEVAIDWPHYQVTPGGNGTLKVGRALNAWEVFRPVEECSFEEVILEPGDVLCLPAGTWHSAEAAGYSLALNLAFSFEDGFWPMFSKIIEGIVVTNPAWRTPPQPSSEVHEGDSLAADAEGYLNARLVDLAEIIEELRGNPAAVDEVWRQIRARAAGK
jgi:ribosomal protein L16 Arg81 hydroxylase